MCDRDPKRLEQEFDARYSFGEKPGKLGQGAYAIAQVARTAHGREVVVKKFQKQVQQQQILAEIGILEALQHENVIELLDAWNIGGSWRLVMQHGGASVKALLARDPIPSDSVRSLTRQLLAGLAYVHSRGLIHNDVTPANLVVDLDGVARLADFGNSVAEKPGSRGDWRPSMATRGVPQVTSWYRAPEICAGLLL